MTSQRNPLSIRSEGRRHYVCGDTYPIKDKLRAAGFKWDPDAKCWWTGKRDLAEEIVGKVAPVAETARVDREGRHRSLRTVRMRPFLGECSASQGRRSAPVRQRASLREVATGTSA